MKIFILKNYDLMCELGAQIVCDAVRQNPRAVLGLATGSTVIGVYREMCAEFEKGLSFAQVTTVNLDEYVGLKATHSQSYAYFMRRHLFDKVDIDLAATHIPNGVAHDLQAECAAYDALLDKLPRDVQLLGLGSDGHIAFNEPFSPFNTRTRVVKLAENTVRDNSRLFDSIDDVPRFAVSMGIADIVSARKILLLANGANKAQAVANMICGNVDESCPASVLQTHSDVTVILDQTAASLLPDSYKE